MSVRTTILDFSSLNAALGQDMGRVKETVHEASADLTQDAVERARMLASFNNAIGKLREEDKGPGVLSSAENALASRLQSYLVERALTERPDAAIPVAGGVQEVKFDNLDVLGWLPTGLRMIFRSKPHPWISPEPIAEAMPDRFRAALFADWGTGLYGSPEISKSIAKDGRGFQLVMHLGDTYYSGTGREVRERLIDNWPKTTAIGRALNGNHEMYSGGKAYFDEVLAFLRQPASCFAYQNTNWLLVGMDTAYIDHNLDERDRHGGWKTGQIEWLKKLVEAAGPTRNVILFSHHQPFSQLDKQGPKLVAALGSELLGRIKAWFWGHEHRCVIYSAHPEHGFLGRCIGHGGFPEFRDRFGKPGSDQLQWHRLKATENAPEAEVLDGPNRFVVGDESRYSPHGFVTLEFDGRECLESYFTADAVALRDPQNL